MIAALSQLIPLIKGHSPRFRQRVITGTNGKWRGGGGLRRREWGLFWQLKDWRQEEREALVAGSCWKRVKPLSICDSFRADAGNHFFCFSFPPKLFFVFLSLASPTDTTETVCQSLLFFCSVCCVISITFLRERHNLWQLQKTRETREQGTTCNNLSCFVFFFLNEKIMFP